MPTSCSVPGCRNNYGDNGKGLPVFIFSERRCEEENVVECHSSRGFRSSQIVFANNTTTRLAHLAYWPVIANEMTISLTALAVGDRYSKIAKSVGQSNLVNANRVITAAMDSHYEYFKLVKRLNAVHMTDYISFSLVCFVRVIYLVIVMIQEVRSQKEFTYVLAMELLSTVMYVSSVSGRFFLTCWAGTQLTNGSDDVLEATLNKKFYQKPFLRSKSNPPHDMFINQLRERRVSLSVFDMFDLGLGTFTSLIETTVTYVIVVVNALGAKTTSEAELATTESENSPET